LIGKGLLKASELGQIVVEREQAAEEPTAPNSTPQTTERRTHAEGS
jgi:hypothetical protein